MEWRCKSVPVSLFILLGIGLLYFGKMASFFDNIFRTKPLHVIRAEENSQDLPRSLSLFDLICIGVGGTVGSGVFATTGQLISQNAGPAAFVSWVIAGVVCLLNAFAYMELVTRVPSSGSTYAYSYHALGELPAVIAAWLITLEYGVSGAGVARSWAGKVQDWLVEDYPGHDFGWMNRRNTNFLGAVVMAFCVCVLLMGVKFGKYFINTVTSIKICVVLFIIIGGFILMEPSNLKPFVPARENGNYGTQGIITASSLAFFGYVGFDEVCCLAAEAKNPKKVMPLAVMGVVSITMFLSCFASLVLSGMVDYKNATNFSAGFNAQGAKWAGQIVHAGEVGTMPVVVLVSFLAQPRLNYALACDGLMPQIFAKVNDKGTLFVNTLISGAFFTLVAFFVPFDVLWDIVNFGILLSFVMSQSSLIVVRMRKESPVGSRVGMFTLVVCGCVATFCFHMGWEKHRSTAALVLAIVAFAGFVGATLYLALKCPQEPNDPNNYSAPLVPFLPALAVLADFYLMSQLAFHSILYSLLWVLAAIVSYFAYGYGNSAGRTGWAALLEYVPNGRSSIREPMLSINSLTPSIDIQAKEKGATLPTMASK